MHGLGGGEKRGKASVNLKSMGHFNLDCRLCKGLGFNEQAAKLSHKHFQCIRISISKA